MITNRLEVPADLRKEWYLKSLWSFQPDVDFDSVGSRLRDLLLSEAIPGWLALLRGDGLLALLRDRDVGVRGGSARMSDPLLVELFLTVDHGEASTLERLLDEVQETYLEDERVDWLRERFQHRRQTRGAT